MLKKILFIFVLFFSLTVYGESENSNEKIVRSIADRIIANTTYDFLNTETKEIISKVDKSNYSAEIKIRSPYNTWHYWNGVLNIAMLEMANYFQEEKYRQQVEKNYRFIFENYKIFQQHITEDDNKWVYPFGQFLVTEELDDCGAMGGGLIEIFQSNSKKEYEDYIQKAANHIMKIQPRLDDGTLVRGGPREMTLWGDDLYMSIVFLSRMGHLTGDRKYFDDAALQVMNFTKYLYDPDTELYYHCWYSDIEKNGIAHWGRCNGWIMLAQADLLKYLPEKHSKRQQLIEILHQQVLGIAKYQDRSGLWHQLLNKPDSYLETSCTAMFTYSIAKAINKGWLDERYRAIAQLGWEGLKSKIQTDGQVKDICIGTGVGDNLAFYYNRPAELNDIHGLGAVLLAGVEVLKMNKLAD